MILYTLYPETYLLIYNFIKISWACTLRGIECAQNIENRRAIAEISEKFN